ncbi:competence pheromone ComX [Bacillus alkalicellulosilyticus]|uniref:competence pheromone ComX n=1 Tax=Alkalihalobacterium alkalicellulosilyticum TaxID=1912214 RepID=UPI000997928B|nr:competence pheromone ComX [Bacillus alkalicellulosilyticus]
MQEIIEFLIQNPDVVEKVKNGTASLLHVGDEEVKSILSVLLNNANELRVEMWKKLY